ncbi:MAG: peptidoglycan DD-metalloendopeptidase family protein [Acidimicrobiales bacterium]
MSRLEVDLAEADLVIRQRSIAMRARAGYLYKAGSAGVYLQGLLSAQDLSIFIKRLQLIGVLQDKDARLVEGIRVTKSRAAELREELERARARQQNLAKALRARQRQLETQLKVAKTASRVARFGKFDGFVLPLLGTVAFSNSWGDPRSRGRRHKGTDVMAPCGARVAAVTEGSVDAMGRGGAGGITLYLRARNGDRFFYAHLKGYAGGVRVGKRVAMGEVIAHNGNTGNARGGPCHVHFEWHPGGGRAVNPYPLLRSALG